MNTLKERNNIPAGYASGFTLIEMLLALVLSSLLMLGVYSVLSGVVETKNSLENANNDMIVVGALQKLMLNDIRMMKTGTVKEPPVNIRQQDRLMMVITQNSLTFNKAIAVDVIYYVEDSTLYRLERMPAMNYSMRMALVKNVDSWEGWTYDGSEYKEDIKEDGHIFKFRLTVDGRVMEFIAGRAVNL